MSRYHPNNRPGYRKEPDPIIEANRARTGNTGELKCYCGKTALYRFISHGACKEHKQAILDMVTRNHNKIVKAYDLVGVEEHRLKSAIDDQDLSRRSLKAVRKKMK